MRVELDIKVVALTSLSIGGEPGLRGIERGIALVDDSDMPFIPSTTLRGVSRTAAYLASSIAGIPACNEKEPSAISRRHRELFGDSSKICPVCGVWGAPSVEGALWFSDALAEVGSSARFQLPHLEIDDYTGHSRLGSFYFEEAVATGSVFRGTIIIYGDRLERNAARLGIGRINYCGLAKLFIASLMLIPAVGIGRSGIAAIGVENVRGALENCDYEKLLEALRLPQGHIQEVINHVIKGLPERIRIVKEELKALGEVT